MNKKIRVKVIVGLVLVIFLANGILIANSNKVSANKYYFTIVAKTNSGGVRPDYLNLVKQQLERIGIKVDVLVQDWPSYYYPYLRNCDLMPIILSNYKGNLDIADIFSENSTFNIFGYHTSMDWNKSLGTGQNEWYIQQGKQIMPPNSEERIQHYHDWQNYMMDELLLMQPLFTPLYHKQYWKTLNGYNYNDGLLQSWGKMSWTAPHFGQLSTNEVVIADAAWSDLNPMFQDDSTSKFISDAIMDPLIYYDADLSFWPHLAESYIMLNDTTLQINTREGIKWANDPDGLFTDEYFDIEDVYFTLYAWKYLSNDQQDYDWIEEMEIIDSDTMRIYIDGNLGTQENEPYSQFQQYLSTNILPEHYLNQTQDPVGLPDVTHVSWNTFATNCFGTGLFEIDTFTKGVETILTVRDDCWRLNTTLTSNPDLDWVNRFGDFSGDLTHLRVRTIPDSFDRQIEFEKGEIDISPVSNSKPISNDVFAFSSKLPFYEIFLAYNVREVREQMGNREMCEEDQSITKGLALRKAISYAIDRVEINNIVHGGEYYIINNPIYEALGIWCNPNIIRYDYDLEKAKYYMNLAGYSGPVISGFEFAEWFSISFVVIFSVVIFNKKKRIVGRR